MFICRNKKSNYDSLTLGFNLPLLTNIFKQICTPNRQY